MKRYIEIKRETNERVYIRYHKNTKQGIPKKYFTLIKKPKMAKTLKNKDCNINYQSGMKWTLDYLRYRGITGLTLNEVFRVNEIVVTYQLFERDADFNQTLKQLDNWLKTKEVNNTPIQVDDK